MEQIVTHATQRQSVRDDRVLPAVRVVATFVIIILVLAIWSLYLHPDDTAQGFAWTIRPRMMAMAVGAGYLMGAYFFVRVLTVARWHEVAAGFLPITAFTISMATITVLHYDQFHWNLLPAQLWAVVYAVTPLLVPWLWWLNQQTDPHVLAPDEVIVPRLIRTSALVVGLLLLFAALAYFVAPDNLVAVWPWSLDTLGGRAVAGWTLIPAVGGVTLWREPRWSGWRVLVEALAILAAFFLIALFFTGNDWSRTNPLSIVIPTGMLAIVAAVGLSYFYFERRRLRLAAHTQRKELAG